MKKIEYTSQQMREWSRRIDVDDIYACMAIHVNEIFDAWYKENIEGAPFAYGRWVVNDMENKNGKIINISSMYGIVSPDFSIYDEHPEFFNSAQYGASKAAVIQLTRYYANYLAAKDIRVNCISPGPFPSEQVQQSEKFIKKIIAKVPLKRIGKPEDLTGALLLLASEASSFITGQNIIIDGGWTII